MSNKDFQEIPDLYAIERDITLQYRNGITMEYADEAARKFARIAVEYGYKQERVIKYIFVWLTESEEIYMSQESITKADFMEQITEAVNSIYDRYARLLAEMDGEGEQ